MYDIVKSSLTAKNTKSKNEIMRVIDPRTKILGTKKLKRSLLKYVKKESVKHAIKIKEEENAKK